MQEGDAKGLASLKLSVPLVPGVVSAEVPIRWSLLRPLLRVFRKAPAEQLVQVVGARGLVNIHADDAGTVDVYLNIVNMTDRSLRIDDLHLTLFYVGGVTTAVARPLFQAPNDPVPPFKAGELNFTIHITSAVIRDLFQNRLQKAQNVYSSPGVELTVGGKLDLFIPGSLMALQWGRAIRLPFHVVISWPEMHINCPSAR